MGWQVDAGPLHFSDKGVAVKPQLKVGYADDNVNVRAGIEDVRDGLSAAVAGQVHREYEAKGNGMYRVLAELKNKSNIAVVDDVISAVPKLLSQVMQTARVRIAEECPVWAKMIVKGGLGVSGAVCLGWANTDGFHMVGIRGAVSVAAGLGADMMVGRHATKPLVKYILGISNICMEFVLEYEKALSEEEVSKLKMDTCSSAIKEDASGDAPASPSIEGDASGDVSASPTRKEEASQDADKEEASRDALAMTL